MLLALGVAEGLEIWLPAGESVYQRPPKAGGSRVGWPVASRSASGGLERATEIREPRGMVPMTTRWVPTRTRPGSCQWLELVRLDGSSNRTTRAISEKKKPRINQPTA